MKCPNCNVNLLLSDKQGVEIDYCPECRGIWLDRGELEKIIERSNQVSYNEPRRSPAYDEHHGDSHHKENYGYDSHGYNKHKKKNFLSELFDF